MSPSAKRNTAVLESSNKFQNPNISNVIAPEAPHSAGGTPPSYESPQDAPEKGKNNKGRNLLIKIGAGALVALSAGIGIGVAASNGGERAPAATETSEPAEPAPEATAEAPVEAPNPGELDSFTGEVLEQTLTIEEMDAITDITEFAQLPYADRLAYTLDKLPSFGAATPDNDFGYTDPSSIPAYFWQSVDGMSINTEDTLQGAKTVSAVDYYTTEADGTIDTEYQQVANSVLENGGAGKSNATTRIYEDSGEWQSGLDRDGKPIDFINVTSYVGDSATGERIAGDITYQVIRQEVKLLSGESVIYYPIAYSVDGKASPVSGYDY